MSEDVQETRIVLEPGTLQLNLIPGQANPATIKIRNTGNTAYDVRLYAEPFQVNTDYENVFDVENNFTQITRWICFSQQTVHLEPASTTEVNFTVNVPAGAAGGGQYAAIFAEMVSERPDANLSVRRRIGTLVYSKVGGETKESGRLEFRAPGFWQPRTTFTLSETAINNGNVDFATKTELKISNIFTGEEIRAAFTPEHIILPETERELSYDAENLSVGIYTISRSGEIFGEPFTASSVVLVCPPFYLILLGLAVVSGVLLITRGIRARKNMKRLKAENAELRGEVKALLKSVKQEKEAEKPQPSEAEAKSSKKS